MYKKTFQIILLLLLTIFSYNCENSSDPSKSVVLPERIDVSGIWEGSADVSGNTDNLTIEMVQSDSTITGTASVFWWQDCTMEKSKFDGNTISFILYGAGGYLSFTGTLNDKGNRFEGTCGGQGGSGTWNATKQE